LAILFLIKEQEIKMDLRNLIRRLPYWPFGLFCIFIGWILIDFLGIGKTSPECVIKASTGMNCLACGTTSSIRQILEGDFHAALELNPLGFLVLFAGITFGILLLIKHLNYGQS
jgi:hypothetical protein